MVWKNISLMLTRNGDEICCSVLEFISGGKALRADNNFNKVCNDVIADNFQGDSLKRASHSPV